MDERVAGDLLRQRAWDAAADVARVEIVEAVVQDPSGERRSQVRDRPGLTDVDEAPGVRAGPKRSSVEPFARDDARGERRGVVVVS